MSGWSFVLLDTTIKGSLLLIPAILISRFGKRLSSEWKHLFLSAAIISLVLIPAAFSLLQTLSVPWAHTVVEPMTMNEKISRENAGDFILHKVTPEALGFGGSSLTLNSKTTYHADIQQILILFWGIGTAFVILRFLLGKYLIMRLKQKSRLDRCPERMALFAELCKKLNIKRNVKVLLTVKAVSPLTFGYLRSVILMPADCQSWSENRLRLVYLHELSHIRRGDNIIQIATAFISAIYWFNPLLWAAVKRLRVEQESACDNRVLNSGIRPSTYATHLLEIIRSYYSPEPISSAANPMGRVSSTEKRIVSILDSAVSHTILNIRSVTFSVLMLIALIVPSFFVNIVRTDAQEKVDHLFVHMTSGIYDISNLESINISQVHKNDVPVVRPLNQPAFRVIRGFDPQNGGIDLGVDKSYTPIIAAADGIVQYMGTTPVGLRYIVIRHKNGISTVYTGFNEACVNVGDNVRQGMEIACTGVNKIFHYEVRIGNYPTDPVAFLNAQ